MYRSKRRLNWVEHGYFAATLSLLTFAACTFNPDTNGASGATIDASDGAQLQDDAIAPEDCPNEIELVLSVNGLTPAPNSPAPVVRALLGDTITLSAVGTCTQAGPISYEWTFLNPPAPVVGTSINSQTIEVYPVQPGDYTVVLSVGNGSGLTLEAPSVLAFSAAGFEDLGGLPSEAKVEDLHAGLEYLWIGTDLGAYVGSLLDPTASYEKVSDAFSVENRETELGVQMNAVFESPPGVYAWFGPEAGIQTVYRLSLSSNALQRLVALTTFEGAKNKDISGSATELRVATDKGSALTTNFDAFTKENGGALGNANLKAVSVGPTGSFAGGMGLYTLPAGSTSGPFGPGDNKIRGFADDGTFLWAASDNSGVVKLQGTTVVASYASGDFGLQSSRIAAMATDAGGDIWATTNAGVHRFKKDREVWVQMSTMDFGIGNDIKAVTIDEVDADSTLGTPSRRAIYIGSDKGLAVMRIVP